MIQDPIKEKSKSDFLSQDKGKTASNTIEIPSIALPKGGGAIKSIDEKFSVNTVNGTASFSIPIPASTARGLSPTLSLSYNSGTGNSIFGLGWSINLHSIKRKTDKRLPRYLDGEDSDSFLFSEAEDLVPMFKKNNEGDFIKDNTGNYVIDERESEDKLFMIRCYMPRIEGLFARIERWTEVGSGLIRWRMTSKDNVTTLWGWSAHSTIANPEQPLQIFEWLPEFVFDDKGNCCQYLYKKENIQGLDKTLVHHKNRIRDDQPTYTNTYLEKILYGNKTPYQGFGAAYPELNDYLFANIFDYGEYSSLSPYSKNKDWDFRPDAFSDYKAGFEIRTTRLCKRILLWHYFSKSNEYEGLVKSLDFTYDPLVQQGFTFLKAITTWGYIKKQDGSYTSKSLPSMEFTYQKHEWNAEIKAISVDEFIHAPAALDEPPYLFTDLFNEGLSGILSEQSGAWYYKHNLGGGSFAEATLVSAKPSFSGLGTQLQLADLEADGRKQLLSLGTEPKGYFELDEQQVWQPFKNFESLPNINFNDAYVRMLDLDGDGRADLLVSEDQVFTWYPSRGKQGFASAKKVQMPFDEELGPRLVFAEEKQSIFLADMSGDGQLDLVRVRNADVCYWPNLGFGRFGTKVTMGHAPWFDHPEAFNPSYIRCADIDGSGTTDLIYLGQNKFVCWMNLNGNAFSEQAFEIPCFPAIHSHAKITVTDLLGTGVACLVWSSSLSKDMTRPLCYIDLMSSKKPHLMVSYQNNLGKEVHLQYTPSTQYYIADQLAGQPWVTKLHFPVHCISKTETLDRVSGTHLVSSYSYHHGYYDHEEKEFRGFGRVDQTDAEHFEHWVKSGAQNVVEAELHQDPVVSKTWSHTGAFMGLGKILDQFAHEHWYKEVEHQGFPKIVPNEKPLQKARLVVAHGLDPLLIESLSAQEWQEALRACKGMVLRTEIFAKDAAKQGNDKDALFKELLPYTVATHNCCIELLQPKGNNKHAVFVVKESETMTYTYERNPHEPRIAHTLNLKLDSYGNVLDSVSVVYPKKTVDINLPEEIRKAQSRAVVLYTQNRFTNDVIEEDTYRLRLPAEVKTYELKEVHKDTTYYSIEDFDEILSDLKSDTALYHELDKAVPQGKAQKRLIEHVRTLYYDSNLQFPLPLLQLQTLALPYENYQLAYTPELLADIYEGKVDLTIMSEGRFVHSEGDDNWWIRSGTQQYLLANEAVDVARSRFYTPVSYTDTYGAITRVSYYGNYFLFVEETEDVLGNRVRVDQFNFRTLSPQRIKDINANKSEILLDEFGLVKAMAVLGKGAEADDLLGLAEYDEQVEKDLMAAFWAVSNSPEGIADAIVLTEKAQQLLQHATVRFVYDFEAYQNTGKPTALATIKREEHFNVNNNALIQLGFEYTNGLGKVAMKKVQAEPGIAQKATIHNDGTVSVVQLDTSATKQLRWIGNGRTVFNNKGNVVKQYEPYFSVTHRYEDLKELVETGVTPIMYYDALHRCVMTKMPQGTFSKIEFDPWRQASYDANDTVKSSSWYLNRTNQQIDTELLSQYKDPVKEKDAADQAALHDNTPTLIHFDTLGRAVLTVLHNREGASQVDVYLGTQLILDVEGNLRKVVDARQLASNNFKGNTVMAYKFDMLGNRVYQKSMDAGRRWLLNDSLGKPLRTWDERLHEFQYFYDVLHRPTHAVVKGGDDGTLNHVFDKVVYGESLLAADRNNEQEVQAQNVLGKIIKHYDTGGLLETLEYDFKGAVKNTTRKLFKKYKDIPNWIGQNLDDDLDATDSFSFSETKDALERIRQYSAPDGSVITSSYNRTGLLKSEAVSHKNPDVTNTYIEHIDYNEKDQRLKVVYGNGVLTRFHYDKETFRVNRLESNRLNDDALHDWYYTFDAVGNITHIEDKKAPVVFFNNQKIIALSKYSYDALYRLLSATGRENNASPSVGTTDQWDDGPYMQQAGNDDPMALRPYVQNYEYDAVGNLLLMKHEAAGNNWSRFYNYEINNNRLKSTVVGQGANSVVYNYQHHPEQGFITVMPHLEAMAWNFKEQLVKTIRQKRNDGGTPETTYYQYDGQGQRLRKITENEAAIGTLLTKKSERIYIAGYETYRTYQANGVNFERQSLSVMDAGRRLVMVETVKQNTKPSPSASEVVGARLVRYQLNNHLGSASLELEGSMAAKVISYEEYHPFGTTAYQAISKEITTVAKRYRYTGMERDEETGLSYHSARYYLPWLGRWLSSDPIDIGDGVNLYAYVHNNPIAFVDSNGHEAKLSQQSSNHFDKLVLGVLRAAKKEGLPMDRAYFLIVQSYGEQAPNAGIQQKNGRYRLFNEHAPSNAIKDKKTGKIIKLELKLTDAEVKSHEARGIYIEGIKQGEEQVGKKEKQNLGSPTFTYKDQETATSHHIELLKKEWKVDLGAKGLTFQKFISDLFTRGYATQGKSTPDKRDDDYDTLFIKKLEPQAKAELKMWVDQKISSLNQRIQLTEARIASLVKRNEDLDSQIEFRKQLPGIGEQYSGLFYTTPEDESVIVQANIKEQTKKLDAMKADLSLIKGLRDHLKP